MPELFYDSHNCRKLLFCQWMQTLQHRGRSSTHIAQCNTENRISIALCNYSATDIDLSIHYEVYCTVYPLVEEARMASATVKINAETYAKLKETVAETGQPMIDVLAAAVEAYRRRVFLEGVNADFANLRKDRRAWADEQAEREQWDATLADDLEGGA